MANVTQKSVKSKTPLQRAIDWLDLRCNRPDSQEHGNHWYPVAVHRNGYAQFCAYIYIIERPDKPRLYYCLDMKAQWEAKQLRRICIPTRSNQCQSQK